MTVKITGKLTIEDSKKVLCYLVNHPSDYPFDERESYYSRSPHSAHDDMLRTIHFLLHHVFSVAQLDKDFPFFDRNAYRSAAADLEKYFTVGHATSAVYDEIHNTEDGGSHFWQFMGACGKNKRWFHGPISGGWITFNDKWNGDPRVPIGRIVRKSDDLKSDPLVVSAYEAYEQMTKVERYDRIGDNYICNPEKETLYKDELEKLHPFMRGVLDQIIARIKEKCEQ